MLNVCRDLLELVQVVIRDQDVIDVRVLLQHSTLFCEMVEHGQICSFPHGDLCDTACWFVANVDPRDGIFLDVLLLRVSPQEAVEMHFLVLKPYRIVHFFYVPKCGEDSLPESDEDSTNVVKDVWTFEE